MRASVKDGCVQVVYIPGFDSRSCYAASVNASKPHVLIVEDEPDIREGLVGYLEQAGFRTTHATDGLAALEAFFHGKPDLVLLDLMLPRLSGLEVLRTIRDSDGAANKTPVIALTAKTDQRDRLHGFELGADDYIPKPFWPLEVVARVQAVLRRTPKTEAVIEGLHGLKLDLETRTVTIHSVRLELRPTEFELLAALLRVPNRVFTRAELLEAMGRADADTLERAVDVHIKNLRKKLGPDQPLETVFGVGYRYAT
jgi:two-component system, OmpR family, response regulator BaeR